MTETIGTRREPVCVDGVEYDTYPLPEALIKVMKRCWAEVLLSEGQMRFGSLPSYRKWENAELGDPNDAKGLFRVNSHPYTREGVNPVYVWCAALPTVTPGRIVILAEHGGYDCYVRIRQPLALIQRVCTAVRDRRLRVQGDRVVYNRGAEVDGATFNSQNMDFNLFQKDPRFSEDVEYRLVLTDPDPRAEYQEFVLLQVGDCSDIMEIERLPNR